MGNLGFLEIIQSDTSNVHIHHNVSDDYQQFVLFWGGHDSLVEHNTVICRRPQVSNVHFVFAFDKGSAKNIHVRNNIFVVGKGLQVFSGRSPYGPQDYDQPRDHNIYFCLDDTVDDPCGMPLGEGDIVADPRFVDLQNRDLHLRPDSPAIDAGIEAGHGEDFEDHPMPSGTAPDMGAYEYQH